MHSMRPVRTIASTPLNAFYTTDLVLYCCSVIRSNCTLTKNLGLSALPKSRITDGHVARTISHYSTGVDVSVGIQGKPVQLIKKSRKKPSLFLRRK